MQKPNTLFFCSLLIIFTLNVVTVPKTWFNLLMFFILSPTNWTFQEYWIHRLLLHNDFVLFIRHAHILHHRHPTDSRKLFIPMEVTIIFALLNFYSCFWIFGRWAALTHISSSIICYFLFEYAHWKSHQPALHTKPRFCLFHMIHHRHDCYNFGFTSATWDILFGTCHPGYPIRSYAILLIPLPLLPLLLNQ